MIFKNAIGRIGTYIPIDLMYKISGTSIFIPYYHMVSDQDVVHVKHLYRYKDVKFFKSDIEYYCNNHTIVTLLDIIKHLYNDIKLPRKPLLLTFDDGFREMHEIVFPILKQKGVQAVFFINPNFIDNKDMCYLNKASIIVEKLNQCINNRLLLKIKDILCISRGNDLNVKGIILTIKYADRHLIDEIANVLEYDFFDYLKSVKPYLTSKQITDMISCGYEIGAHSLDHPLYYDIPISEQVRQTIESMKIIKQMFNINYGAFSFPHNDRYVSSKFFNEIYSSQVIDLTFGTDGFLKDAIKYNLQRINVERSLMTPKRVFAMRLLRKIYNNITNTAIIERKS